MHAIAAIHGDLCSVRIAPSVCSPHPSIQRCLDDHDPISEQSQPRAALIVEDGHGEQIKPIQLASRGHSPS